MKKFFPKNRYELKELVKNKSIYLGDICTSAITDMGNLFLRAKRKNFSGIEYWDTSNVITMEGMFAECKHFDIPIGCWDVSKVKDMSFMFYGCAAFKMELGLLISHLIAGNQQILKINIVCFIIVKVLPTR